MQYSALIVGLGRSGIRFMRAVQYLNDEGYNIRLAAIVDQNIGILESLKQSKINVFVDYKEALKREKFDIIINCLNEKDHYNLLKYIANNSIYFKRIISEKPLTETLKQAEEIKKLYDNDDISINFLERYSLVICNIRKKLLANELKISRANFFWGKYRIFDHRPTMGVLSELSHPIDLITWLADVKHDCSYQIKYGFAVSSGFSPYESSILDSISLGISFSNGLLITGLSSFVWEKRDRRIELFLTNNSGEIEQLLVLRLDAPFWDRDTLSCYDINLIGGKPKKIFSRTIKRETFPNQVDSIYKLTEFLKENIANMKDQKNSGLLAFLNQGVYVQSILGDVESMIQSSLFYDSGFQRSDNQKYLIDSRQSKHKNEILRITKRENFSNSYEWDDGT